jgi:uncharacterized membrane protein HdeD (DUF308 family)
MNNTLTPSSGRLKTLGFISIALGIIALASPAVAANAVIIVVGLTLLASGIAQVIHGFSGSTWKDRGMPIILGVITCLGGVFILTHKLFGLGVLSLMITIYFVVEGLWKIIASFKFRPNPGWIWFLIGGIFSLVLGLLIWNQWPLSGIIAVGILVGADLLTTGITLVMLGSAVKRQG